jgi:hypothetical protein
MPGVKISNLPAATTPTGPELVPIVQAGTTKRTTVASLVTGGLGYTPVNRAGDTMTGALNYAATVTLASAATTNIATAASNDLIVTGTTTITAFGTVAAGALRVVTFAGALILTHNATSLILPGGANITTAAGDVGIFKSLGSGNWRCVSYLRASGVQLIATAAEVTTGVDNTKSITPLALRNSSPTVQALTVVGNITAGGFIQAAVTAGTNYLLGPGVTSPPFSSAGGIQRRLMTKMLVTGTVRVQWRAFSIEGVQTSSRVYKNGVAQGTLRTLVGGVGGSNAVYTDDVSVVLGDNIEIYATTTDGDATAVVSGINIGTGTLTSQPSHIGATERVYDTWFTGV